MKSSISLLAGMALFASGLATSQVQGGSTDERVAKLEKELAVTGARVAALETEVRSGRELLTQYGAYLERQSQAAAAMVSTLEASEKAGFAWGDNFRSREILLAGWREQLASLQQDLPRPPAAAKNGKTAGR